jgi:hypothetical protein
MIKYDKEYFQFRNKFGELITFGSVVYYPVFLDAGSLTIKKLTVNNIVFHRNKRHKDVIQPMVLTQSHILNLDDCRKTYDDAEEVIHRWKRKVVDAIQKAIAS